MKKLFIISVLTVFFVSGNVVHSTDIPLNVKIIKDKKTKQYSLIDKSTKKPLLSIKYDNMERITQEAVAVEKDGKVGILYNNNAIAIPVRYDKVTNEGRNYFGIDTKNKVVKSRLDITQPRQNIALTDSNFENYPSENILTVIFDEDKKLYGFVKKETENTFSVISPQYEDYFSADKNSLISQALDITYSKDNAIIVKKGGKWGLINRKGQTIVDTYYDKIITFDAFIEEALPIPQSNGLITDAVMYQKIDFPASNNFIAFKDNDVFIMNLYGQITYGTQKPKVFIDTNSTNLLEDLYKQNNNGSAVRFVGFPQKGIVQYEENGKYGLIVVGENGNNQLPAIYDKFYFPDENSLIFNMLNISYAPLNQIWGFNKTTDEWVLIGNESEYSNETPRPKELKETSETFKKRLKPAITFDNKVVFNKQFINVINNDVYVQDIKFKNFDWTNGSKAKYQYDVLKDISIDAEIHEDKIKIIHLQDVSPYKKFAPFKK